MISSEVQPPLELRVEEDTKGHLVQPFSGDGNRFHCSLGCKTLFCGVFLRLCSPVLALPSATTQRNLLPPPHKFSLDI